MLSKTKLVILLKSPIPVIKQLKNTKKFSRKTKVRIKKTIKEKTNSMVEVQMRSKRFLSNKKAVKQIQLKTKSKMTSNYPRKKQRRVAKKS